MEGPPQRSRMEGPQRSRAMEGTPQMSRTMEGTPQRSRAMEGPPQRVDANIALLGAEDVGKSGKFKHTILQPNERKVFKRPMNIVIKPCVSVLSSHRAVLNQKIYRRIWRYR